MNTEFRERGSHLERAQFFDPATLAEPLAFLAQLRQTTPVARITDPGLRREVHLVTSYALVQEASRRAEDFSSQTSALVLEGHGARDPEVDRILAGTDTPLLLQVSDPPDHTHARALVAGAFSRVAVANLEGVIERIVDDLIDDFIGKGTCDFVVQFAAPLSSNVTATILGLRREDFALTRDWVHALVLLVDRTGTRDQEIAAVRTLVRFGDVLRNYIEHRRRKPQDDLISHLVLVRADSEPALNDAEIVRLTMELIAAGYETTQSVLTSGLARLLQHSSQLERLLIEPMLIGNAVEEILRFETPATGQWRVAVRDTSLGGVEIPAGAALQLRFDAANRDPVKLPEPDAFDIRRANARMHLSFGAPGLHHCMGNLLARRELGIALTKVLARLHDLRIDPERSDLTYRPAFTLRGIRSLGLTFTPRPQLRANADELS
ncbi:MAG: cytochrome P450 [Steroidobacteraceae bacterium]